MHQTAWVPEYAREYLAQINRPYNYEDLLTMAKRQQELEEKMSHSANKLLFCDTGPLILKVWSMNKFGKCDPWILELWGNCNYDLIFLCGTEVPWEEDPLRENPDDRDVLYEIYKRELEASSRKFFVLKGTIEERVEMVQKKILQMI